MSLAAVVGLFIVCAAPAAQAEASPPYSSCKAAAADGRYDIPSNDSAYSSKLDSDGDGVACEKRR